MARLKLKKGDFAEMREAGHLPDDVIDTLEWQFNTLEWCFIRIKDLEFEVEPLKQYVTKESTGNEDWSICRIIFVGVPWVLLYFYALVWSMLEFYSFVEGWIKNG
jgi:hypothetical protein